MENEKILSKHSQAILDAFSKGYKIDEKGNVIYNNKKLKLYNDNRKIPYYSFSIRLFNGERFRIKVHRYQAYIKYGNKIFEKDIEVRHYNGNSLDNSWNNILIGTHSDNIMDIKQETRIKSAINASYKNRRFSDEEVSKIIEDKKNGFTYKMICEKYKTSKSTLSFLFNEALYAK